MIFRATESLKITVTTLPHLFLISNGSDISQNAMHLLLWHALADIVLDEATKRSPDGADVILTQVTLFIAVLPAEQTRWWWQWSFMKKKATNLMYVTAGYGVSPVIKTYGVQQKLNSIFFPELFPVVFDDGGHVLDMTCRGKNQGHNSELLGHTLTESQTQHKVYQHNVDKHESHRCVVGSLLCSRCWSWTADVCEAAAAAPGSSHMSPAQSAAAQQQARWHRRDPPAANRTQTTEKTKRLYYTTISSIICTFTGTHAE